jgi:hypothetical protein
LLEEAGGKTNKGVGQLNSGKKMQEGQSKLKTKQKINRKMKNKQTKPKTKEKKNGSSGKEEISISSLRTITFFSR